MKYFEIQDSPELKYAPQLKNWYGKFDVRNIRIDSFPKLPDMQLFTIESSKNTIFTDLILFPFLLVSPMVQEVIKMYRECCFFRKIVLLDQENQESRLYYLPVLDETNAIQIQRIQYKMVKETWICLKFKEKGLNLTGIFFGLEILKNGISFCHWIWQRV